VQLAVFVEATGLEVSLYLGSAQAENLERLRKALAARGDELLAPLARHNDQLVWEVHGNREHPLEGPREYMPAINSATAVGWLDEGGTSIKWYIHRGDPLLDDANLADRIGELFRALHPLASAARGDPLVAALPDSGDDEEGVRIRLAFGSPLSRSPNAVTCRRRRSRSG
jgi:hypothetical protein